MNEKSTELEKNELAEWIERKFGDLKSHTNVVLLGLLVLVLCTLVLAYWLTMRINSRTEPWRALQAASANNLLTSQTSAYEQVYDTFPDSIASLWARQRAGDFDVQSGLGKLVTDREAALKQIERGRKNLAMIQESTVPNIPQILKERSLFSLAYADESLGKFDDARKLYERILADYPESPIAIAAKDALTRLADPAFTAAFAKYAAVTTAPGMKLPAIPDISFPEETDSPAAESGTGG